MDFEGFDRLTRALAGRVSRRGVIKGAAAGSVAGPAGTLMAAAAQGDGKDDKKEKDERARGRARNPGNGGSCLAAGEECQAGDACCAGLACQPTVGGLSSRCLPGNGGSSSTTTTTETGGVAAGAQTSATNNSVCAGECDVSQEATANTVGFGGVSASGFGTLPAINIDVDCTYEEQAFQTVCVALGGVPDGGPAVTNIALPFDGVCAVPIDFVFRPPRFEEFVTRKPIPGSGGGGEGGGQASAGNGGNANSSADGGTISIGDVNSGGNRGDDNDTNINVSADGGTSNADASGGDGNTAVVGGGGNADRPREEIIRELRQVEPASLTVVLEGNVAPGRNATWWIDTEQGRLPASGPSLNRVADESETTGSIALTGYACPGAEAETAGDWFGRCTDPAAPFDVTLTPVDAAGASVATKPLNDLGRTRFGNLPAGRYRLEGPDGAWCRAESDAVNAEGEVVVEAGRESSVWVFTCPSL